MVKQKRQPNGQFIRRDPPLPPLSSPDPVTIHDLSPEDRARAIIIPTGQGNRFASSWYFPEDRQNASL